MIDAVENVMGVKDMIDYLKSRVNKDRKECLDGEFGDTPGCVDDRNLVQLAKEMYEKSSFLVGPEQFNGPQFLGGSLALLALSAEYLAWKHPNVELSFENVYDLAQKIHQAAGLKFGVHMDNHHGEYNAEKIAEIVAKVSPDAKDKITLSKDAKSLIPGCGFAGLLADASNRLHLSDAVSRFFQANPNLVDYLVQAKGARLAILDKNHAPVTDKKKALAMENHTKKSFNRKEAIRRGVQSYNHDTAKLKEVLSGYFDEEATNKLAGMNQGWLKITFDKLAGSDADQIGEAA